MPGYLTREVSIALGDDIWVIRTLLDRNQFADPDHLAETAGISSALWSLFGQLWPAGDVLARHMQQFDHVGKRMLELGCGLALSSMVLQRRGADITASDHHPLAAKFLADNATRNGLAALRYADLPWETLDVSLGRFDVLIASDVLYERGHGALLAAMVDRHAQPICEVLITDPGRGHANAFTRLMAQQNFVCTEFRQRFAINEVAPFRGRLLRYWRA